MKPNLPKDKIISSPSDKKRLNDRASSVTNFYLDLFPEISCPGELDTTTEVNWCREKNNSFKQIACSIERLFSLYPNRIDDVRNAFSYVLSYVQNLMNKSMQDDDLPSSAQLLNSKEITSSEQDIYDTITNEVNLFKHFKIICTHKRNTFYHIKNYLFGLGFTSSALSLKDFIKNILPISHLKTALDVTLSSKKLESFFLAKGAIGKVYLIPLNSYSYNKVVLKQIMCPKEKRKVINISAENDAFRFNELMKSLNCPHYAKAFSYHYGDDNLLVTPYIEGKVATILERMCCIYEMNKAGFIMHDDKVISNFITDNFGNTVVIDVDHVANTRISPSSPRSKWVIDNYGKKRFFI